MRTVGPWRPHAGGTPALRGNETDRAAQADHARDARPPHSHIRHVYPRQSCRGRVKAPRRQAPLSRLHFAPPVFPATHPQAEDAIGAASGHQRRFPTRDPTVRPDKRDDGSPRPGTVARVRHIFPEETGTAGRTAGAKPKCAARCAPIAFSVSALPAARSLIRDKSSLPGVLVCLFQLEAFYAETARKKPFWPFRIVPFPLCPFPSSFSFSVAVSSRHDRVST